MDNLAQKLARLRKDNVEVEIYPLDGDKETRGTIDEVGSDFVVVDSWIFPFNGIKMITPRD